MAMSFSASKPISQVVQALFNFQKRHFKLTVIDKVDSSILSAQARNVSANQGSSDVAQTKGAVSYGHESFTNLDSSNSSSAIQNHSEVIASKGLHTVTGGAQVQDTYEANSSSSITVRDLQVDVPHLESKAMQQKNDLYQGQQRVSANGLVDPTTMQQVYYFDTLACMKKLETKGFTREQAEASIECLVEVINSTLDHQAKHMITKSQQEIAVQHLLSEIISVKKDMVLLQKSEFSSLRSETEKIGIDMNRIETHFQDEVVKLKGQFSLDINLERGRALEAHAENEKNLQLLHNKIDTEIANLKTTFEIYRNDIMKFAGGTVLTVATLILGFIRLWK